MTDDDLTADAVARLHDDISHGHPCTGWHDDVRLVLTALEAAQAERDALLTRVRELKSYAAITMAPCPWCQSIFATDATPVITMPKEDGHA